MSVYSGTTATVAARKLTSGLSSATGPAHARARRVGLLRRCDNDRPRRGRSTSAHSTPQSPGSDEAHTSCRGRATCLGARRAAGRHRATSLVTVRRCVESRARHWLACSPGGEDDEARTCRGARRRRRYAVRRSERSHVRRGGDMCASHDPRSPTEERGAGEKPIKLQPRGTWRVLEGVWMVTLYNLRSD
jgi:hypothetical protein